MNSLRFPLSSRLMTRVPLPSISLSPPLYPLSLSLFGSPSHPSLLVPPHPTSPILSHAVPDLGPGSFGNLDLSSLLGAGSTPAASRGGLTSDDLQRAMMGERISNHHFFDFPTLSFRVLNVPPLSPSSLSLPQSPLTIPHH